MVIIVRVVIAEKPNTARSLSAVVGAVYNPEKKYSEGNGYIVTSQFGHLVTLFDIKDYDPNIDPRDPSNIPFIPQNFEYKAIEGDGYQEQLDLIKALVNRSDVKEVIHFGDNAREGQLLVDLVLDYVGNTKPVYRLAVNEYTNELIKRGLEDLKPIEAYKGLSEAGYARQIMDWLIGIAFTLATTVKYSADGKYLKVGRVVLPTLKMIYDREMEIKNFKPVPFYTINMQAMIGGNKVEFHHVDTEGKVIKYFNKSDMFGVYSSVKNGNISVSSSGEKTSKKTPSMLFSIDSLQGHMTKEFSGYSAKSVLQIVQKLYDKKYLTYPRTECNHIHETDIKECEVVINKLSTSIFKDHVATFNSKSSVFNSAKVTEHSAIRPTRMIPKIDDLSKKEQEVYMEVAKRFYAHHLEKAEYIVKEILVNVENEIFTLKGKSLVNEGWLGLYDAQQNDKTVPMVNNAEDLDNYYFKFEESKTTAPNRYTEDTLLKAMKFCGKNIDHDNVIEYDDDFTQMILDGYSIGTGATRASTIEKLLDCNYTVMSGKTIKITDTGIGLVNKFPINNLLDVNFSGRIEKALMDIQKGLVDKDEFINKIKNLVEQGCGVILQSEDAKLYARQIMGACPTCGNGVYDGEKTYYCSLKECDFRLYKSNKLLEKKGIKLNKSMVGAFLKGQKVQVNGIPSDKYENSTYDAVLSMEHTDEYGWGVNISYDVEYDVLCNCPEDGCNGDVVIKHDRYKCNACRFTKYKKDKFFAKYKKTLTKSMAKKLINDRQAEIKDMVSPRTGGKFTGNILMVKEGEWWNFLFKRD